jgi:hypothetical protein
MKVDQQNRSLLHSANARSAPRDNRGKEADGGPSARFPTLWHVRDLDLARFEPYEESEPFSYANGSRLPPALAPVVDAARTQRAPRVEHRSDVMDRELPLHADV